MNDNPAEERRKTNGDLARLIAEAGVKLSILEDARSEMSGLRDSVLLLSEAIAVAPTAEEVEAAERRGRLQILAAFAAGLLVIGVLGAGLLHGQHLQRQGIRCVALQLFEHRVSNQASHDQVFEQFHIPIPEHRPLPAEPTQSQVDGACRPFLPKATSR